MLNPAAAYDPVAIEIQYLTNTYQCRNRFTHGCHRDRAFAWGEQVMEAAKFPVPAPLEMNWTVRQPVVLNVVAETINP